MKRLSAKPTRGTCSVLMKKYALLDGRGGDFGAITFNDHVMVRPAPT